MLPTLTIKEIRLILGYKKNSSAKKWLARKGIEIQDKGSKSEFVIRSEFEMARYGNYIRKIQMQHPENWQDVLKAHENNDVLGLVDYKVNERKVHVAKEYNPTGKLEKLFAEEWGKSKSGEQ
jgi:hypothetical protein